MVLEQQFRAHTFICKQDEVRKREGRKEWQSFLQSLWPVAYLLQPSHASQSPQTVSLTEDKIFKDMSLWESFSFKPQQYPVPYSTILSSCLPSSLHEVFLSQNHLLELSICPVLTQTLDHVANTSQHQSCKIPMLRAYQPVADKRVSQTEFSVIKKSVTSKLYQLL